MDINVVDYISVEEKLKLLNLNMPDGITLLPYNLVSAESLDDLRQKAESATVRKLFRSNNTAYVEIFDNENQPAYLEQYGFEWFGPTLFVSASMLIHDPNTLSVALGLITNYLYDLFKGSDGGKASLDVIFQNVDGSCKKIAYSGPPEGLSEVAKIVKELKEGR